MTEYVTLNQDTTFYDSDGGETGTFGLGGIGQTAQTYDVSKNRAMSAAKATIAGDIGSWAETWTMVYVTNPYDGQIVSSSRLRVSGYWSAYLDSLAGATEVRLTAFVRNQYGDLDSREVVQKTSNIVDFWTGNDTFSVDLYADLEVDMLYEVGIRAKTTAQALTYSAGLADCYTDDGPIQYSGRYEYNQIDLDWF